MNMRSPAAAMLWELWRLTRAEAAWKLALGIVVALVALILSAVVEPSDNAALNERMKEAGATIARAVLFFSHFIGWLSIAAFTGKPTGFPLNLHYAHPIRTAFMVGLPTAYLTLVAAAIYLVSAFLVRAASGHPFSLLPAAAWIAAMTLIMRAFAWSTRSPVTLILGSVAVLAAWMRFVRPRLDSFPNDVGYPLTDYAVIALIGLVCFGITVASVARQRRGDMPTGVPVTSLDRLSRWLADLIRFHCPTSSATRAQLWFDLKSSGLPTLATGVVIAIVILLLSAVSNPIDAAIESNFRAYMSCSKNGCFYGRGITVPLAAFALLIVLFQGRNAFGIRRKQGRTYLNAFEATQAHGAAQLAALKVLVKSVCVSAAIIVLGASAWISISLLGDAVFVQMWEVPLSSRLTAIKGAVVALTGYQQLSLVVVAVIGVVTWVAMLAVFAALRARYPRRVNIAGASLLLCVLALALLALAESKGMISPFVIDAFFTAVRWMLFSGVVFATVYFFWSGFADRVLTGRYASGAVAISAAFVAAWLTVLNMAGVQLSGMSVINAISILLPVFLALMVYVLAPWSLSRVRHM